MARDDQRQTAEPRTTDRHVGPDELPVEQAKATKANPIGGAPAAPQESDKTHKLVMELERQNRRLRRRCEEAELEIVKLERSVKNTENTLSFRLGHALIHSTKSLRALRTLPSVLLELSQDSRRRRPQSLASSTLSVLRAQVGRLAKREKK